MNSLPQEEPQKEVRQLEANLFQQMARVQQPMQPEPDEPLKDQEQQA